jgi:dimethylglycine dehydrogenase
VVGRGTAGGYGHYIKKSLMQGYLRPEHAVPGTICQVRLLGELRPARVIAESPYDPGNAVLRGCGGGGVPAHMRVSEPTFLFGLRILD